MDQRCGRPAEPDITRSGQPGRGRDRLSCHRGVARHHHGHIRHRPHHREILQRVVRRPVVTTRQAAVAGHDVHRQIVVRHVDLHLLTGAERRERRHRVGEGNLARRGERGRDGDHVRLRDAKVHILAGASLGEALFEPAHIGVAAPDARVTLGERGQRTPVHVAARPGVFLRPTGPLISERAWRGLDCHLDHSSLAPFASEASARCRMAGLNTP